MNFFAQRIKRAFELRRILAQMTIHDLQTQFAGSALGIVWSVIHPLMMALVLWFVFSKGLKAEPVEDVPFSIWLFCGLFPWTFFSTAVSTSCTSLQEQSYLVKRTGFCIALIPFVKVLAALAVHAVFLLILFIFAICTDVTPKWQWLQLMYYITAIIILSIGISWLVASLNVFLHDVAQVVNVILQFGFWLTPVFWVPESMPVEFTKYLIVNPMAYVLNGYRESIFGTGMFWQAPLPASVFWLETIILFAMGLVVFRRLKPHFADVL